MTAHSPSMPRQGRNEPDHIDDRHALLAQAGAWNLMVDQGELALDDAFGQLVDGVADITGLPECNVCSGRPCPNLSFCNACRVADRQRRPAGDRTRFLRKLVDPTIGFDTAYRLIFERRCRS